MTSLPSLIVFTDLDGCLLNKTDYDATPALPVVRQLSERGIPLVLCSSKTETEMQKLAARLSLPNAPMTCENGGAILWSDHKAWESDEPRTILGVSRTRVLQVLGGLKPQFAFRGFADLTVAEVAAITDLPLDQAADAMDRHSTEPLLWDDADDRLPAFTAAVQEAGLQMTRGGRFWHVSGPVNKGAALLEVCRRFRPEHSGKVLTAAIGDSPIDQSMLDVVDIPIAIPTPQGTLEVQVSGPQALVATTHGAAGWAECVAELLRRLEPSS